VQDYGADVAYPISDVDKELPKYLENVENIYYTLGNDDAFDKRILDLLKRFRGKRYESSSGPGIILDPIEIVRNMRAVKDEGEIALIRKAVDISSEAYIILMKSIKPGMYEYEAQAILEYHFVKNGASESAYPVIAGTGSNATCLHYDCNNCLIRDGDLLLVDAGAEYKHYAADITRTFPVNGKFTKWQKNLYNIVLSAQKAGIEAIKPGLKMDEYYNKVLNTIVDGLMDIGLLKGNRDEIMEKKEYNKFYMHNAGHWLGLDVHDVGINSPKDDLKILKPGMVVTIEPGIYIAEELEEVDEKYKGTGIRIEDDVLVTKDGNEVLTYKVPKEIEDIEEMMK
ncbi:aminopeptidase P family protein, partial [Candidatus Poribacteria bacterium]|nr:aminopeptidase P family protein [Candidatus Poribacteria bacterium]